MTANKRMQGISIFLAVGCLLAGSTLYLLFRPTTLLMFYWADSVGLMELVITMRAWVHGFDKYLPTWVVYSLPFALWVFSYLFFIEGIWKNSTSSVRHVWFWCIPVIAIAAELAQSTRIIPGSFDIGDMIALILATSFGFFAAKLIQQNKEETEL